MTTSANIVNNLYDYTSTLKKIESILLNKEKQNGNYDVVLVPTVTMEYNAVKLALNTKNPKDNYGTLYFRAVFQIIDDRGHIKEIYCVNKDVESDLNKFILNAVQVSGLPWSDSRQKDLYSKEVIDYLDIADRIARESHLYSSGDDYYPGYFSAIVVGDDAITLKQINHYNARSIDHKEDYHMRELEITIPLSQHYDKTGYSNHKIGHMMINFSDRSSKLNKTCGEKMLQKIEEEKLKFELDSSR